MRYAHSIGRRRLARVLLPLLLSWILPASLAAHVAHVAHVAQVDAWPEVPLPAGVTLFDIAPSVTVDGLPMQVRGFLTREPAADLAARFRSSLGMPLVENRVGMKTVLGQVRGKHYLSVQIEPAASGARGVIALSDPGAFIAGRKAEQAQRADWLARLPAGMRILSLVSSRDGGRRSEQLVLGSPHASAYHREALLALLRREGYALQHVVESPGPPGEALYFAGQGREAMATLCRDADGGSLVLLNMVRMDGEEPK
jgi:hypothetical protein